MSFPSGFAIAGLALASLLHQVPVPPDSARVAARLPYGSEVTVPCN